jgi:hypothetical protein
MIFRDLAALFEDMHRYVLRTGDNLHVAPGHGHSDGECAVREVMSS